MFRALILVALLALLRWESAHAYACGLPPIPPIGMTPVCVCDSGGMNCRWIFISR